MNRLWEYAYSFIAFGIAWIFSKIGLVQIDNQLFLALLIILLIINLSVLSIVNRFSFPGNSGIMVYLGVTGITLIVFLSWLFIYNSQSPTPISIGQALFFISTYFLFKIALIVPLIRVK